MSLWPLSRNEHNPFQCNLIFWLRLDGIFWSNLFTSDWLTIFNASKLFVITITLWNSKYEYASWFLNGLHKCRHFLYSVGFYEESETFTVYRFTPNVPLWKTLFHLLVLFIFVPILYYLCVLSCDVNLINKSTSFINKYL